MNLRDSLRGGLVVLACAFAAGPAGLSRNAVARAQDEPGARAAAEARWRALSPEQRTLVRERFHAWQAMEPERRRAVETRHEALRRVRARLLDDLPEDERRHIESLGPRERKRALRPELEQRLDDLRQEIRARFGEGGVDKRTLRSVRRALLDRAGDHLAELEEQGLLPEGEAERLLSLSPLELGRELRRLNRLAILEHPPKELLLLPPDEREALLALPPDEFLGRLKDLRTRGGRDDARGGLPRAFREAAEGRVRSRRPPPREVLEQVLSPAEIAALAALDPAARVERIHALLREKARAALPADERSRRAWEAIEALPPRLQERRWLKIIDPALDTRRPRR